MGRNVKQLKNYTTEQVETLFESDANNVIGVKLYAIIQLTRGYSTRKLEEFYRVTHKQICNRADRFDAEGIDGLRIKPGRGRKTFITEAQKTQLKADLLQSPETFGFNTANWSGPLVRKHLENKFQVRYKQAAVYVLMHSLGLSFQRTRGKYPERNEKLREEVKVDIKKTALLIKYIFVFFFYKFLDCFASLARTTTVLVLYTSLRAKRSNPDKFIFVCV